MVYGVLSGEFRSLEEESEINAEIPGAFRGGLIIHIYRETGEGEIVNRSQFADILRMFKPSIVFSNHLRIGIRIDARLRQRGCTIVG